MFFLVLKLIRFPVSTFVRVHLLVVDCVTSLRLAIISNTFDIIASPRLGRDRSETAQITTLNLTIETTGARCDSSKTPRFTKDFQFLVWDCENLLV